MFSCTNSFGDEPSLAYCSISTADWAGSRPRPRPYSTRTGSQVDVGVGSYSSTNSWLRRMPLMRLLAGKYFWSVRKHSRRACSIIR
jgi:hypothetical protein